MNIIIPMAGEGRRFKEAGYKEDKPFINIDGKAMIRRVVDNLPIKEGDRLIIICRRGQEGKLRGLGAEVIPILDPTEGAACTVLLAERFINTRDELLIANSDQIVEYNLENWHAVRRLARPVAEGIVWLFKSDGHPKWSYAKVNYEGTITEVAEKDPISEWATCGLYYWSSGHSFVRYAEQMIDNDTKVNGEFYTCPVYNEALKIGKSVLPFFVDRMHGLGTPEDLENYILSIC